jgi:membrane protein insertase Oxa1/YidC/SpoIIIJ
MDRQEFFQSYMDHWGVADVLLDCYVDLLTMEMIDEKTNKINRMSFFKQLLSEHHIKCKEQQVFEDEIHQLQEELQRIKNK